MAASAQLTGTASLIHNNLGISTSGTAVSVHNSLNPGSGKLLLHSLSTGQSQDGPEVVQVQSIRYVETATGPLLCVALSNGTQFYSEDAGTLLHFLPLAEGESEGVSYHQGACFVPTTSHIVIGTSKGTLAAVHVDGGVFSPLAESAHSSPTGEVADVCFSALYNTVATVHNNGDLRTWTPDANGYIPANAIPNCCQAPVRVLALGSRLCVADGMGTLLFYDAASFELQIEVTAHARNLTACALREDLNQIVTVGEDTVINCWHVEPTDGKIALHHSSVVSDKLLTGVAIHAAGASVTAYDSDQIYHINF
eukprot:TRINITY_DN10152_c3_g2_i1.p1 TRINITY_DN10152_c3_g2~~TRINITY_DN10152_c3_g2_i1.p1  ORF type:complete len:310 (-),score=38.96 TRINITY_DN10152_c3_g2_i1:101-1030(-)